MVVETGFYHGIVNSNSMEVVNQKNETVGEGKSAV
jgi:hypothetical protein